MSEQRIENPYRVVVGLYEALVIGDENRIMSLLSSIRQEEAIMVGGVIMTIDLPTESERQLMKKSQLENREYALIKVGDQEAEIQGDKASVDRIQVWQVAKSMIDMNGQGIRVFSHTHYDKEYSPIPTGPDIPVMRQYTYEWNFSCRVVSWLPDTVFVFKGTV